MPLVATPQTNNLHVNKYNTQTGLQVICTIFHIEGYTILGLVWYKVWFVCAVSDVIRRSIFVCATQG